MCSCCHLAEKCALASVSSLRLQTPSHWVSTLHNAVGRSNWKGRISLVLQRCKACPAQQLLTSQQFGGECATAAAWMGVVSLGSICPLLALSGMPASCPSREKTRSLGKLPGLVYERESHLYYISFGGEL